MYYREHRWLQYVSVVAAILLIAIFEANISIAAKGLLGAPFLVVVAGAAILSNYTASSIAILLGAVATNYVTLPKGFSFDSVSIFLTLEFILSGVVVFMLSVRGNTYRSSNLQLIAGSKQLQALIKKLKKDNKMTHQQVTKLNTMNDELKTLVDEFIAEDNYWVGRWPAKGEKPERKRVLPTTKLRHQ